MTTSTSETKEPATDFPIEAVPPVLFFDGECGLCNHSVRWLLDHDQRRVLRFAPLQGELAARKLSVLPNDYHDWSVALWDEDGVHVESDAALRAVACLGGFWRLARLLLAVPRVIRNSVYRFVARNRIRSFGRVDSCALLSAEDRDRLLP
jgi:predicted DCC family thiol-disulfide oxidoreductase YuxK